ncbi:MAG: hypothetical protein ACD_6C00520G0001 [uncultured bacterium]|nr:MAG: hypothetical protein ACD_6C00520G0001 [uncultured bacterium]
MNRRVIDVRVNRRMRVGSNAGETSVIDRATLAWATVIVVTQIHTIDCA